jgi:hypothetical protein
MCTPPKVRVDCAPPPPGHSSQRRAVCYYQKGRDHLFCPDGMDFALICLGDPLFLCCSPTPSFLECGTRLQTHPYSSGIFLDPCGKFPRLWNRKYWPDYAWKNPRHAWQIFSPNEQRLIHLDELECSDNFKTFNEASSTVTEGPLEAIESSSSTKHTKHNYCSRQSIEGLPSSRNTRN